MGEEDAEVEVAQGKAICILSPSSRDEIQFFTCSANWPSRMLDLLKTNLNFPLPPTLPCHVDKEEMSEECEGA